MSEKQKHPHDIIPKTLTTISDTGTDCWQCQIKVNRALWRCLTFGQQADINRKMSDLQMHLEDYLQAEKTDLSIKLEMKKNARTDSEQTKQANGKKGT